MKTENEKVINGLGPIVNVMFSSPNSDNPNPNRPEEDPTTTRRGREEEEETQRGRRSPDAKNDVENLPMDEDNKNRTGHNPEDQHPGRNPM